MRKLILASASKRRYDLLKNAGYDFFVVIPEADEESLLNTGLEPNELVINLAKLKADVVLNNATQNTVVLAADTIVYYNKQILGKPINREHAFSMLKMLSGNMHTVYTGVHIAMSSSDLVDSFYTSAQVAMYPLDDSEIERYIDTNDPMDKAGSYGIQGIGSLFISEIKGDFFSIAGLPISKVYRSLKKFGIEPEFTSTEYI